jgi:hypothetical protein
MSGACQCCNSCCRCDRSGRSWRGRRRLRSRLCRLCDVGKRKCKCWRGTILRAAEIVRLMRQRHAGVHCRCKSPAHLLRDVSWEPAARRQRRWRERRSTSTSSGSSGEKRLAVRAPRESSGKRELRMVGNPLRLQKIANKAASSQIWKCLWYRRVLVVVHSDRWLSAERVHNCRGRFWCKSRLRRHGLRADGCSSCSISADESQVVHCRMPGDMSVRLGRGQGAA